jgi:hypothetical protein
MRPSEKSRDKEAIRCRGARFLQSTLSGKYREKWASFAYFGGKAGGISLQFRLLGGESGIRTHVTLSSKHAFQACAFSHSAISPRKYGKERSIAFQKAIVVVPRRNEFAPAWPLFILWTGARQRKSAKQRNATRERKTRKRKTGKRKRRTPQPTQESFSGALGSGTAGLEVAVEPEPAPPAAARAEEALTGSPGWRGTEGRAGGLTPSTTWWLRQ